MTVSKDEPTLTNRGFRIYGEFTDSYGNTIRVQESSAVGRPRAYIFCNQDDTKNWYKNRILEAVKGMNIPSPELLDMALTTGTPFVTVEQAKILISELQKFVEHAESDDNWRNDEDYIKNFG